MAHGMRFGNSIIASCVVGVLAAVVGCSPGTGGPQESTWQLVMSELPSGVLSVSGTSADDVYVVGTDAEDGSGSLLLNYDGSAWRRINTGTTGNLWWISAVPIDGDFYLTGENGLILRFDPEAQTFEQFETPGDQTIFGIWGFSQNDIWAVGGLLSDQQFGGTIWHYDGNAWSVVDLSEQFPEGYATVFKIWGRSPNELYAVGAAGLVLQYDGTTWTLVDDGTERNATLFSVYGNADSVVAVGGFNSAVIIEQQASGAFADVATPDIIQMNGISVTAEGRAVAVGRELNAAFRTENGWEVQDTGFSVDFDFHAAWIDPDGGVWAVGGVLIADPINRGVIAYYGPETISTELAE
ncbi:MAG: hypothetical protein ACKVT0_12745 [Planctomycetaceae bacterium]